MATALLPLQVLAVVADHVATAGGLEAMPYVVLPVLWVLGVIVFVWLKLQRG